MTVFPHPASGYGAVLGLLGAALCLPLPACAEDHPRLTPTRDVTVVYALATPNDATKGGPGTVKVAFSGAGDLLRIDSQDGNGVTILDRPGQQVTLVMMKQQIYTRLHPTHGLHNPFMLDLDMQYTPAGHDTVAGVSCDLWTIQSSHGKATACVTTDGVILRENGVDADGVEGSIKALSVSYQDIPASAFQPPEGFHELQPKARPAHQGEAGSPTPSPVPEASGSDTKTTTSEVTPPDAADPDTPLIGSHDVPVPATTTPGSGASQSGKQSAVLPGLLPGQTVQPDTTQPSVPNDSAGDGSVSTPDQPPSGSEGGDPK
ncbi:hypothetical protein [Gluconobacter kanchanaburiensis]|uniref:DUF4412 domain-containing protein n=1 Tax=Gluconobacter kanchanaburiensis NBRC 103587 TaxID=1307948 RepID=A0A511B339_9PROT|nr:hypothetical protein [Gluconobacter kanchanaburiensis]MBF0860961.1 hypothetical protein [Gluconobacter kanchanaburiensis]GBR70119.1 hypothetical protein AA103587_1702 [Gluconobacter kanchanaburiensis NBRC 103587]GEK94859.1 hypothetical protein GKA01_00560 [Gluconobacter kanchanaburiensis NBRC 103587]